MLGGCGACNVPNTRLMSRDGLGGEELAVVGLEFKFFGRGSFTCTAHHLVFHLWWDVVVRKVADLVHLLSRSHKEKKLAAHNRSGSFQQPKFQCWQREQGFQSQAAKLRPYWQLRQCSCWLLENWISPKSSNTIENFLSKEYLILPASDEWTFR